MAATLTSERVSESGDNMTRDRLKRVMQTDDTSDSLRQCRLSRCGIHSGDVFSLPKTPPV